MTQHTDRAGRPRSRRTLAGLLAGACLAAAGVPAVAARAGAAPAPPPTPRCTVDAKLVPTCGLLWGAAAGGFSSTPRDRALRVWEAKSGRPASVYHTYHRGDDLFPTAEEVAMANEPGKPRLLFMNWKVAQGGTWADVAAGAYNDRIDRLASYIRANYRDRFFLTLHHEPENDVDSSAGSGMSAAEFAAMFRHTTQRLRDHGVTNAVFVLTYMGVEKFHLEPWWPDLYPGDDVVDWIALDAYVSAKPGGYHYGTFKDLMNRTADPARFPGFYAWHQTHHRAKPLMLAEWGVYEYPADPARKARILARVLAELALFPELKGMLWFDTATDQHGCDIRIDSSVGALAAFRRIAADPRFTVKVR